MKSIRFSSTLAMVLIACASFAQKTPEPPAPPAIAPVPPMPGKGESIIIHKNSDSTEKLTIVIDGDNITINGQPAKDFKNGDVEVIRHPGWNAEAFAPLMHGGPKVFSQSFNYKGNEAVLGVMPVDGENGAKVSEVTTGSAAEKAGLKEGDVITKINDKKIENADDLVDAVGKYKPTDKVTITYMRDKKQNTTTATLDKNKASTFVWNGNNNDFDMFKLHNGNDFNFMWNDKPRLGLRVQDTENGQGVTVKDINDDDSPAAKAGLKEDDVITAVNGKAVQSVKDVKDQLKDLKPGDDVKLTYKRNATTQTATVHIPKPLQTSDL